MARVTEPRGLSLVDLLVGMFVVSASVFAVTQIYAGVDCRNMNTEAERMLPRVLNMTVERERDTKGRVELNDCGFTSRGATGDCAKIGLTSNSPTLFSYVAVPKGSTTTAYAIGQTPETYGSVIELEPNKKINKSAARCR